MNTLNALTRLCFVASLVFLCSITLIKAQNTSERIINYDTKIEVLESADVIITENITVFANQNQIKRGIFRTFPTTYKGSRGERVRVGFEILSVQKNGVREPYFVENASNGKKIYIGDADIFLDAGVYTYTIQYKTNRQIGFFEEFDELYWNVTGNDWGFIIENASATLILPKAAAIQQTDAYTGFFGKSETDASINKQSSNQVEIITTRELSPNEGLTIAVSWQKGVVQAPTTEQLFGYFLRDNLGVIIGLLGLILTIIYFYFVWKKVGVDPPSGTIIPLYEAPKGFTPAATRYIMKMGYDNKAFAATIVDMAIRGYLKIDKSGSTYTLTKTGASDSVLTATEKNIASYLFGSKNSITLKNENHSKISGAITVLKESLKMELENIHFKHNYKYLVPGIFISILTGVLMIVLNPFYGLEDMILLTIVTSIATAVIGVIGYLLYKSFKTASGFGGIFKLVFFILVFSGAFGSGTFAAINLNSFINVASIILIMSIIGVNILFYYLIKAPTILGRKNMDEVEGFKMFLTATEEERLKLLNPPNKTPELFEKILPYAIALNVDKQWSNQFTKLFETTDLNSRGTGGYRPIWYGGAFNTSNFTSSVSGLSSSLATNITSSSVPPGSSSGGGGGGFSGGGGGGGGGGGW